MEKLKFMCWNINGRAGFGNYSIPVKIILDVIIQQKPHIIVLTEFISVANGCIDLKNSLNDLGYCVDVSPYQVNNNGILIAYKKEYKQETQKIKSLYEPNFMCTQIKLDKKKLVIAGIRIIPTDNWSDRKIQLKKFFNELNEMPTDLDFIAAGDFNNGNIQFECNKNFDYPNCNRSYYNYQMIWRDVENNKWSLITPDQGGPYKGGKYSIITKDGEKKYHTKDDHIISSLSKDKFKNVDYNFDFVCEANGYGKLKSDDYLSDLIGLPDHAILISEINLYNA